jgi:transcriptional regulator with XRE-family HTH domain
VFYATIIGMSEARSPLHPLDQWLSDHGHDREWLAEMVGITKGSLSRIINGKQWGSREFFHRLFKVTAGAITPDAFLQSPKPLPPERVSCL